MTTDPPEPGGAGPPPSLPRRPLDRPAHLIASHILAASAPLLFHVRRHGEKIQEATVLEAASTYAEAVTVCRNFHANEIML